MSEGREYSLFFNTSPDMKSGVPTPFVSATSTPTNFDVPKSDILPLTGLSSFVETSKTLSGYYQNESEKKNDKKKKKMPLNLCE